MITNLQRTLHTTSYHAISSHQLPTSSKQSSTAFLSTESSGLFFIKKNNVIGRSFSYSLSKLSKSIYAAFLSVVRQIPVIL